MNTIEYFNKTVYNLDEEIDLIKDVINYAIQKELADNLEFNIIFVDDEKIRELNKIYRNKDSYTDVISFALEDYEDIKFMDRRLLGDIYISIDTAKRQAEEFKNSLKWELMFLSVHGLLHLLGYNHDNNEDEKIMFSKQEMILNEYGN